MRGPSNERGRRSGAPNPAQAAQADYDRFRAAYLDDDRARSCDIRTWHESERGRLAASRRPDKDHEFPIGIVEIDAVKDLDLPEALLDRAQDGRGHG